MRKRSAKPRYLEPDPRFGDPSVTRFVNNLMLDGKKNLSYTIFYNAMDRVEKMTGENPHEVWKRALVNVTPAVEVKSRRIGGSNFQIPTEIRPQRRISMAMKWLIGYSRKRSGRSMAEKLANEIAAAAKGEGAAVKKREDVHKMAEANKAFSHFRT